MNDRHRQIIHLLGWLFFVLSILFCIPLVYGQFTDFSQGSLFAFGFPALISLFLSIPCIALKPSHSIQLTLSGGMILCALAWIFLSLLGGLPFLFGGGMNFTDAFFESVSGFTTAGMTTFSHLSSVPKPLLLWRGLSQWVGGLGILTFFLFVTFQNEGDIWQLFTAESHKMNTSRPVPNIYRTIQIFWIIYVLFSFLEFCILLALKMPFFDSVFHALTTVSTGGFSIHDANIGHYRLTGHPNAQAIEYTIIFFMTLGGMNFLIHYQWLTGQFKALFSDDETKFYFKIILFFTAIIAFSILLLPQAPHWEKIIRTSLFHVVSLATSTGFTTSNMTSAVFTPLSRQLFLILMVIGGCVGSTSGGAKMVRALLASRLYGRDLKQVYFPRGSITPVLLNHSPVDNDELFKISGLFFIWFTLIFVGAGITTLFSDLTAFEALSGMASAVGNMGPFYFEPQKVKGFSPVIKYTYIFGMIAGRLEMLPMFVLFQKRAWKALNR